MYLDCIVLTRGRGGISNRSDAPSVFKPFALAKKGEYFANFGFAQHSWAANAPVTHSNSQVQASIQVIQPCESDQRDAKGVEVGRFVALQRHPGGSAATFQVAGEAAVSGFSLEMRRLATDQP
jgi:hypothetical protein